MAGLYIHIPFCHSKCAYCDFYSTPGLDRIDAYLRALRSEMLRRCRNLQPATIYIGGGTPSILSLDRLSQLLDSLPLQSSVETTVEVNPEDVTPDLARLLSTITSARVSMGVQTLVDAELAAIGRRHTADRAIKAVDTLRNAGLHNLSLDLIFGLPLQSLQSWQQSLDGIFALQPDHLSAYSLMLEKGTRLWALTQSGKLPRASQSLAEQMYLTLCDRAARHGFDHYEISNFSRPGMHSRHNSAYWDFTPYIGLGASAHSFDGVSRRSFNPSSISSYIDRGTSAATIEQLSPYDLAVERIMLSLRTSAGLDLNAYATATSQEEATRLIRAAQVHIDRGAMALNRSGNLIINPSSWLVADSIIVDIMPSEELFSKP